MLLLLPFLLVLALKFLTRIFSGEPIFYSSIRLGLNRQPFRIFKFSTLNSWSQEEFEEYLELSPEHRREWEKYGKFRKDPRGTFLGRILRRFSLDELPQLWNILRGEMNLIGPRPITDEEDKIYGRWSEEIHTVPPGITGLWQVSGRNLTTYRRRIVFNLYYVRHRSLKLNLWIILKTFWAVLGGRGAY